MLGSSEVRWRVNSGALLLEDPIIDGTNRAIGCHEVLERERQPHPALGAAPFHDWLEPCCLGFGEKVFELSNRLGRLSHANLCCQLFVIEDTCQTVVESHCIESAGSTDTVGVDAILVKLRHWPVVPSEC